YNYAFVEGAGGAPSVFDTPVNQAARDVFDVSQPVASQMLPLVNYIKNLALHQPVSVAFPYTEDPFAAPPVQLAHTELTAMSLHNHNITVLPNDYSPFTEPPTGEGPAAAAAKLVAQQHPTVVILGSTDVPMVKAFVDTFQQNNYNPQLFVAASGPDQGAAFANAVGPHNVAGIMVPDSWYGGVANTDSQRMVREYIAKYGGTPADVNADVAEAYSVGEVMAQAITATGGVDNAKIIQYLHSGAIMQTVQGKVQFDALGENSGAVGFMFQWTTNGSFVPGLSNDGTAASSQFLAVKPNWGAG
ncbi:MAG TPA: ABC transporter substrate-binding protein, partial [Trebonia sp.]